MHRFGISIIARTSVAAEENEEQIESEPLDEVDQVIQELCDMFEQQNGRAATDKEIGMWIDTIKEANAAGAFAQQDAQTVF